MNMTEKSSRHAALFDLDGVLIDTEGIYSGFWESIDRLYPTGIDNFAAAIKGTTLTEILSHFPTEQIRADIKQRIHDFEETMVYELMPGVDTFLDALVGAGWPIAIYTSSDDKKMSCLRRQQPRLFELADVIVTGSQVSHSKPDPEGYNKAAEMLGCPIGDCVVFEDSLQGLEAGRRSGAVVVGLATTNPASVIKGKARVILDGFTGFGISDLEALFD